MRVLSYFFICLTFVFAAPLYAAESIDQRLQSHIKFSQTEPNTIGHITIDDRSSGISDATWLYVKKALDYYKQKKPIFIVLELNTPGGEVFAAQKISDALKEMDIQDDIPVVAFINNWAISAGAMLAYSSRFIAITKDASMGAAEPVLASQTGELKEASEKVNSAMRADFANRARFFDRNPYIAEGMVDKDIILVSRNGEIIKVDSEAQMRTSDILIKPKGKLLTLNAEQLIDYHVADLLLPPLKIAPITEQEREIGKWPASKMLLFQQPYFSQIPHATVDSYRMDWKTQFFVFLANPVISSLLLMGLMVGFYLEMSHPGFGLPGTLALVCLFLIILSNLSLQIANWLEVILLVSGLLIIIIDLLVLPTFGLLGIIGGILFLAGLFAIMLPGIGTVSYDLDSQTMNAAGEALINRFAWLSGTILLGALLIVLLARYVTPKVAKWSKLVLVGNEQEGFQASEYDKTAIGKTGVVLADLKPGGYILVDDKKHQAISLSGYIAKGEEVSVIGGQEESLIVKQNLPQSH